MNLPDPNPRAETITPISDEDRAELVRQARRCAAESCDFEVPGDFPESVLALDARLTATEAGATRLNDMVGAMDRARNRLELDHASAIAALRSDVARLEGERDEAMNDHATIKEFWDDQCAHVHEACQMLGVNTDNEIGDTWTLRKWCADVKNERDALAAKLAEAEREIAEYAEQSDYADDAFRGMCKMKDAAQARVAELEAEKERATANCERRCAGLTACMDAVATYLNPNWSNDMPWEDDIICAIENGHGRNDRLYAKQLGERIAALEEALREIAGAEWLTHESEAGVTWNTTGIDPQDIAKRALDGGKGVTGG